MVKIKSDHNFARRTHECHSFDKFEVTRNSKYQLSQFSIKKYIKIHITKFPIFEVPGAPLNVKIFLKKIYASYFVMK